MIKKDKFGKLCKDKMAEELSGYFKTYPNFVLTDYMGSTVADLELVRRNLKAISASYVVVKNSILRVVFDKGNMKEMSPMVDGGMAVSFSGKDMIATCKVLADFSKTHEKFKIKAAMFDGKMMPAEVVKSLAALPSREVLLAHVVGAIKSPITGFVNTLGGIIRKVVYVIDAIKNTKQVPAASAAKT